MDKYGKTNPYRNWPLLQFRARINRTTHALPRQGEGPLEGLAGTAVSSRRSGYRLSVHGNCFKKIASEINYKEAILARFFIDIVIIFT